MESEVEDEVDQLDTDTDGEGSQPGSREKTGDLRRGERVPGTSLLPTVRLENIIQADGVTGNLALSKEGLFVLSIATEEFIKRMIQAGQLKASSERRNMIHYRDMAATTQQYQEFMFLNDTIPPPISLSEALHLRKEREKELLADDPTLPAPPATGSVHTTLAGGAQRTKEKSRATNGSASASSRREKARGHQHLDGSDEPSSNGNASRPNRDRLQPSHSNGTPASDRRPSPLANGHATSSRSGTVTPAIMREDHLERVSSPQPHHQSHTPPFPPDETWTGHGQYTGPASGFLQGPGGPFSRASSNPGRTIYSHNHRID
ncbi:hypothetical protein BD779DRAFT_1660310 [Infundibulicybe gibba]|nr:hypothetical protein BD779DRAFT_1660310 [Infundibulicybe gibba]